MLHKRSASSVCKPVIGLTKHCQIPSDIFLSLPQKQRRGLRGFFGYQRKRERERKHGYSSALREVGEKKDPLVCFAKLLKVPWLWQHTAKKVEGWSGSASLQIGQAEHRTGKR